jgi:integrase
MPRRSRPRGVYEYTLPSGKKRWGFVLDAPPADGQIRRQIRRTGFATERAATVARDEWRAKITAGLVPKPADGTVAAFAATWLTALPVEGLERSTVLHYEMCLKRLLPLLGTVRLQDLAATDLDGAYAALLTAGSAARTVRASHTAVKRMLAEALRLGLVGENVTARARPPRPKAARAKRFPTWTLAELRRFLEAIADDEDIALWSLLAWSGMRRGEVMALRWEDVDLDAGVVTVARAVSVAAGNATFTKEPKTTAGRRLVDLDDDTVAVLRSHRKEQAARQLAVGPGWRGSGLLFCRVDGAPRHPNDVSGRWAGLVRRVAPPLGLPPIRLHDLRHSHATQLLGAGVRPDVVTQRLGHASVAFTLDTYGHVLPGDQRTALGQLFGGV